MKIHPIPSLIGCALLASGAVTQAVQLVTNGAFEAQTLIDPEILPTIDGWAETSAPEEIGVFRNDAGFLAPLGNTNLVYMGAGSQILQTLGGTLQPNTKYTITFDCYMSLGAPAGASINGALCYGTGTGTGSGFGGFIDAEDIQLGSSGFSTALANTPTTLTATFTTGASIVGSANNLAIFINPGILPGAQIFLDNVQVTAETAVPTTQAELVTNGDFSAGAAVFGGSPTDWNATIGAAGVGQFSPAVPAPLTGQVAYMGANTQIVHTLGQTLLPDTTYYISFDYQGSVGDFSGTNTFDGFIGYGTGSGATSGFAGFIAGGDLLSGSNVWSPRITTAAQSFNISFTTPSVITGSSDNLAIILNPALDNVTGFQVYLDNVSVIAATQVTGVPTLSYSRSGSNFTLSWPVDVTGWTLESSTDLGIADTWDPVPGVVNNSVTLDMTGFPKNFFRLKSNP
jgi:hypothetical protein